MKILLISILLIFTSVVMPIILIVNFIRTVRLYKKRKIKIDTFSDFNKRILSYSKEIVDMSIQIEYLNYISKLTINFGKNLEEYYVDDSKLESIISDIYNRFGNNIPSLQQEYRDRQLKKILK